MWTRSVKAGGPASRCTMAATLADAIDLCLQRRVQLTSTRRALLEILWEHPHRPMDAYALIRRIGATSMYRAIQFLSDQDLVMRVATCNAYFPCPHPGTPFAGALLLCDVCGKATSVSGTAVERLLVEQARSFGFMVRGKTVELHGVCGRCAGSH